MSAKGNGHDASMPAGGFGGRGIPPVQAPGAGGNDDLELLTPQDIAQLFHVPVTWVYAQTRTRSTVPMPNLKLGRYVRFQEAAVRRWFEGIKRGYTPQPAKSRKR